MDQALTRADRAIKQLQLRLDTETNYDRLQLAEILVQILDYPDLQQAQRHRKANQIGNFDLISDQNTLARALATNQIVLDKNHLCQCCGMIVHKDKISYCEPLRSINVGLGTMLYFNSILFNALILFAVAFLFSLYFLITNILACQDQKTINCGIQGIGLSYKIIFADQNQDSLKTSSILGIVIVSIWGVISLIKAHQQRKIAVQLQKSFVQASQFTLMLQNFPANLLRVSDEQNLKIIQNIFKQYQNRMNNGMNYNVAKINIASNLYIQNLQNKQNIQKMQLKLKQKQQKFKQWIRFRKQHNRFATPIEVREKQYDDYLDFFMNQYDVKEVYHGSQVPDNSQKVIIFVTMQQSDIRHSIVQQHQSPSLFNFFNLCHKNLFPVQGVKISKAPPPEQIKWTNIGFPFKLKVIRTIGVYIFALLLLAGSLAMTYGLNQVQKDNPQPGLSIAISLIITIINFLMQFSIMILSYYLNQITQTRVQFNIAFKICLFQILNVIGVPLVALYISKRNLYKQNGLSSDIFFIALFNILPPLGRFIDPYCMLIRFRNWIYSFPYVRLNRFKSQSQYNKIHEDNQFDLGYQYAYIIKTVIFTSFFLCLQPIIAAFGIIGLLLMFFVNKYRVLYRFFKPRYYSSTVNTLVNQLLNVSPMMFGLGMLVFINWQTDYFQTKTLILNWVIFIVGGFFFLFPFKFIYKCWFKPKYSSFKYSDKRPLLPSQYDRMNLVTKQAAITQHRSYLKQLQAKKQLSSDALLINQSFIRDPMKDLRNSRFAMNDNLRMTFKNTVKEDFVRRTNIPFYEMKKKDSHKQERQNYNNVAMNSQSNIIRDGKDGNQI